MSWHLKVSGTPEACKRVVQATTGIPDVVKALIAERIDVVGIEPDQWGTYGVLVETHGHFDGATVKYGSNQTCHIDVSRILVDVGTAPTS